MEQQLQDISDKQKASWNKFSPGWEKWDFKLQSFMQPMSDEIIGLLKPTTSDIVLDIAAGTGEPGLSIATLLDDGKVFITDLADDMLNIAREKAAKKGIKNIEFCTCDVSELPFADNTFDAVSCRMGFMFFPDMYLAVKEIHRVLKPGGRFATSVWNKAEKNFWVTAIRETINRNLHLPDLPLEAPGMFRCGSDGLMADLFHEAGFKTIVEKEVTGTLNYDSADIYWTMMTDIAAPFVAALSKADDALKEKIKIEACNLVIEKYPTGNIIMEGSSLVIYGEK